MALEQREVVVQALREARWILADAARALGVSRQGLYKAMARLGIERLPADRGVLGAAFARGPRSRAAA